MIVIKQFGCCSRAFTWCVELFKLPIFSLGLVLVLLIPSIPSQAHSAESEKSPLRPFVNEWLQLIQADFPQSCAVELSTVGIVFTGNNGRRGEEWRVHTCQGDYGYWVEYYPSDAFPNRETPYEITRKATP